MKEELLWLEAQIADTKRLLGLVGNHPVMSLGLKEKLKDLRKEVKTLLTKSKQKHKGK